jgi:hypothetical protein
LARGEDGKWAVAPTADLLNAEVEQLVFDVTRSTVYLNARLRSNDGPEGTTKRSAGCAKGLLGDSSDRGKAGYTVCNSRFTQVLVNAGTVVGGVITSGAMAVLGTAVYQVELDAKAVLKAVEESGAIEQASRMMAAAEHEQFVQTVQNAFAQAKTSAELNRLIGKHEGSGEFVEMVDAARARLPVVQAAEAERAARDAQLRAEQQAARKLADAQRQEQERQATLANEQRLREAGLRVGAFRKALKVESDTNCGPVVEVKGNLVKVYFPVASYGNEHWVSRRDLFPPDYGCRFVNGQYIAPAM